MKKLKKAAAKKKIAPAKAKKIVKKAAAKLKMLAKLVKAAKTPGAKEDSKEEGCTT